MHDALTVQFANCHNDLSGIELDNIFRETTLFLEYLVELTAIDERHNKI